MDHVSASGRSRIMQAVRSRDTRPELEVRRHLHAAGLRFRLHRLDLPGRPDIVLPRRKTVIFVHGCFWHQHQNCDRTAVPRSNRAYWLPKLDRTRQRDEEAASALRAAGWHVEIVWECQISDESLRALSQSIGARRQVRA